MKKIPLILLAALAPLSLIAKTAVPVPAPQPWRLFASLSMTKLQVNSAMPDISGAFLRLPNGRWAHFGGDQIKWVSSVEVSPEDPGVVFLGCGNGILRSADNGRSWRMTTDWHVADVFQIQADPTNPSRLYAATGWGIWRSTDGGEMWIESDRGLPLTEKFTQSIVIDRSNPSRLTAGTDGGLYASTDGADSWTRIGGAPKAPIFHVEQSVTDPQLWIAGTQGLGILISTDGGSTWSPAPALARTNVYGAAIDPSNSERLAAAGWSQGVLISTDGGKSWRDASRGLPSVNVSAMVFDRMHAGRLWASTFEEGTFYTDDFGRTWKNGGLYGAYVSELRFLPNIPASPHR